jgi:murein DD-endopeptidase MepM/ murein hydrolase activator NlpD
MVKKNVIFVVVLTLIVLLPFILLKRKNDNPFFTLKPQYQIIEGYISEGDVLGDVLLAQDIPAPQVSMITSELKEVFNVRKCNIGDRWELYMDEKGTFTKFIYYNGPIDFYVVEFNKEEHAYLSSARKVEAEKRMHGIRGAIRSSLYESMTYVNIPPEIIIQFAEIFASKVDFFTDCRTNDNFNVLWESYFDKHGNILKDIRISAASYSTGDNIHYAFYFETPEGRCGYYDENGKSVESAFLKAPLNYRRISSHFTYRRFHPILKRYRPHLGIDYAAPTGTPVSSIGNGTVTFAGRKGGLGNAVIIKHPNGYISWYGHLSKIARGVRKGTRVKKGQVIAYVGSTGLSTGPHLDFRIQSNGKFLNFLKLKMPPSYPLPDEYLPQFNEIKDFLADRMKSLKETETVFEKGDRQPF